jgi:predicted dehydrogenase
MRASTNRRTFLMQSAAAGAAAVSALELGHVAHAQGSDVIKVGLVGCGGRGTGAAEQALTADSATRLTAMGDAFEDYLNISHDNLKNSAVGERVEVPTERRFVGFDAYKSVIDSVDLVLLTTPPGFRPLHFAYAVAQGKNAFIEKPMAVDAPGLRKFVEAAKAAKEKNLSVVNGFCWRYHNPRRETMKRVFDGQIGPIRAIETTYNSQGVWDPRKPRAECGSEMEYQMRNWYYYCWLSGDHIVEQAVHGIDTMNWAMQGQTPLRCSGVGGRQARTDEKYGDIWDHFSLVYEYPENVRAYHQCRHWPKTEGRVKDYIMGGKGIADVFGNRIEGDEPWRFRGDGNNMYQTEHDEMFAAIRAGEPINNAEQAAVSTLLAIMGRMAAYTGKTITWEEAMASVEDLTPPALAWGDVPKRAVPVPGVTPFI